MAGHEVHPGSVSSRDTRRRRSAMGRAIGALVAAGALVLASCDDDGGGAVDDESDAQTTVVDASRPTTTPGAMPAAPLAAGRDALWPPEEISWSRDELLGGLNALLGWPGETSWELFEQGPIETTVAGAQHPSPEHPSVFVVIGDDGSGWRVVETTDIVVPRLDDEGRLSTLGVRYFEEPHSVSVLGPDGPIDAVVANPVARQRADEHLIRLDEPMELPVGGSILMVLRDQDGLATTLVGADLGDDPLLDADLDELFDEPPPSGELPELQGVDDETIARAELRRVDGIGEEHDAYVAISDDGAEVCWYLVSASMAVEAISCVPSYQFARDGSYAWIEDPDDRTALLLTALFLPDGVTIGDLPDRFEVHESGRVVIGGELGELVVNADREVVPQPLHSPAG